MIYKNIFLLLNSFIFFNFVIAVKVNDVEIPDNIASLSDVLKASITSSKDAEEKKGITIVDPKYAHREISESKKRGGRISKSLINFIFNDLMANVYNKIYLPFLRKIKGKEKSTTDSLLEYIRQKQLKDNKKRLLKNNKSKLEEILVNSKSRTLKAQYSKSSVDYIRFLFQLFTIMDYLLLDEFLDVILVQLKKEIFSPEISNKIKHKDKELLGIFKEYEKVFKLLEINSLSKVKTLQNNAPVNVISYSPQGKYFVAGLANNQVKVWNVAKNKYSLYALLDNASEDMRYQVNSLAFSPNGENLVVGTSYFHKATNTVNIWNLKNKTKRELLTSYYTIHSLSYSSDGNDLLIGSNDIKKYNFTNNQLSVLISSPIFFEDMLTYMPYVAKYSPDGKHFAIILGEDILIIKKILLNQEVKRIFLAVKCNSISYSPDGRYIAVGLVDGSIRIYSAFDDVQLLKTITNVDCQSVESICFSPDGEVIAAGYSDNKVRVWDVETKKCIITLNAHKNKVSSVSFSPDGIYLASGSLDKKIIIWKVKPININF